MPDQEEQKNKDPKEDSPEAPGPVRSIRPPLVLPSGPRPVIAKPAEMDSKQTRKNLQEQKRYDQRKGEEEKEKLGKLQAEIPVDERIQMGKELIENINQYIEAKRKYDKGSVKENVELESKIEDLKKQILPKIKALVKYELPPELSQATLIELSTYLLQDADAAIVSAVAQSDPKKEFAELLTPHYLDRLILGKGSKEYSSKKSEFAKAGKQFVKEFFSSGPPSKKIITSKLQGLEKHFGNVRGVLHRYLKLEGKSRFTLEEQERLKETYAEGIMSLSEKWTVVRERLNLALDEKYDGASLGQPLKLSGFEFDTAQDSFKEIVNTVGIILKDEQSIPEYVTRDDLLKICLCAPILVCGMNILKNIALLKRLEPIEDFIEQIKSKVIELKEKGISVPENEISKVLDSLEESKKLLEQHAEIQFRKSYIITQQASLCITAANTPLDRLEKILTLKSQMEDMQAVIEAKKLDRIATNPDEHKIFVEYMKSMTDGVDDANDKSNMYIDILKKYKADLESYYENLKEVEQRIKLKKTRQDDISDVNEQYEVIQGKLKEIEAAKSRIDHVIKDFQKNSESEKKAASKIHKTLSKITSLEKERPSRQNPSRAGMVSYVAIMTRKSIIDKKPTREYINKLYNDDQLVEFLNSSWHGRKKLKSKIESLEERLVIETVKQLGSERRDVSESVYRDKLKELIQQDITSCTSSYAKAKTMEHWEKVKADARIKGDQLTVSIIESTLSRPMEKAEQIKVASPSLDSKLEVKQATVQELPDEEKKKQKKESSEKKVIEAIKEIREKDSGFSMDMLKLSNRFASEGVVESSDTAKRDLIYMYISDITKCKATFDVKYEQDQSTDSIITNLTKIADIFESKQFIDNFDSLLFAAGNTEWITEFNQEYLSDKAKEFNDETIKPAQYGPRYRLLLDTLIENTKKMQSAYRVDGTDAGNAAADRLEVIIVRLEKSRALISGKLSDFNKDLPMISLCRMISYKIMKSSTQKSEQEKKQLFDEIKIFKKKPAPHYDEVIRKLHSIQASYKIDTQVYVEQVYQCEADRLSVQLEKLKKQDPPIKDIELIELNYKIAINLLMSAHDKNTATQESIIRSVKVLCSATPPKPRAIINLLNSMQLGLRDKLLRRRLHHRALKENIWEYIQKETQILVDKSASELEQKDVGQYLLEKNTDGAPLYANQRMVAYLEALKLQWETEGEVFKLSKSDAQHNRERIRFIAQAIAAIDQDPTRIDDNIFRNLKISLTTSADSAKILSESTAVSIKQLDQLVEKFIVPAKLAQEQSTHHQAPIQPDLKDPAADQSRMIDAEVVSLREYDEKVKATETDIDTIARKIENNSDSDIITFEEFKIYLLFNMEKEAKKTSNIEMASAAARIRTSSSTIFDIVKELKSSKLASEKFLPKCVQYARKMRFHYHESIKLFAGGVVGSRDIQEHDQPESGKLNTQQLVQYLESLRTEWKMYEEVGYVSGYFEKRYNKKRIELLEKKIAILKEKEVSLGAAASVLDGLLTELSSLPSFGSTTHSGMTQLICKQLKIIKDLYDPPDISETPKIGQPSVSDLKDASMSGHEVEMADLPVESKAVQPDPSRVPKETELEQAKKATDAALKSMQDDFAKDDIESTAYKIIQKCIEEKKQQHYEYQWKHGDMAVSEFATDRLIAYFTALKNQWELEKNEYRFTDEKLLQHEKRIKIIKDHIDALTRKKGRLGPAESNNQSALKRILTSFHDKLGEIPKDTFTDTESVMSALVELRDKSIDPLYSVQKQNEMLANFQAWLEGDHSPFSSINKSTITDYIAHQMLKDLDKKGDEHTHSLESIRKLLVDRGAHIDAIKTVSGELNIDPNSYIQLYLRYQTAQVRDAQKAFSKDDVESLSEMAPISDLEEKLIKDLASYLTAVKEAWQVEEQSKGGYSDEEKTHQEKRIRILDEFIAKLKASSKPKYDLPHILSQFKTLQKELTDASTSPSDLNSSTAILTEQLSKIKKDFLNPLSIQAKVNTTLREAQTLMASEITPTKAGSKESPQEYATKMRAYLRAVNLECRVPEGVDPLTEDEIHSRQETLLALQVAIKKLRAPDITLQAMDAILDDLTKGLDKIEKPAKASTSLSQIQKASRNIKELRDKYIKLSLYNEWLEKPSSQKPEAPDKPLFSLNHLQLYLAQAIEQTMSSNSQKDDVIRALHTLSDSTVDASKQRQYIYDQIAKLGNPPKLLQLLVQHAAAERRDLQDYILKEKPEDIDKAVTSPGEYDLYVAKKMTNYLESIKAEWEAHDLATGENEDFSKERKKHIEKALIELKNTATPSVEATQVILENLNKQLRALSPAQPTPTGSRLKNLGYTVSRTVRSILPSARKLKGAKAQTEQHIGCIDSVLKGYIAPFQKELGLKKDDDLVMKEHQEEKRHLETKKTVIHGAVNQSHKGIIGVYQSFFKTAVDEGQGFWISDRLELDKRRKIVIDTKKESRDYTPVKIPEFEHIAYESASSLDDSETEPTKDIEGTRANVSGLPSGSSFYYQQSDGRAIIRESNIDQHVEISLREDPEGYERMSDEEKEAADLTIADAMVRLWVARCGVPVPITDTENQSRMKALITVCRAHNLEFDVSIDAERRYTFISDESVLKSKVDALKTPTLVPIRMVSVEGITKVETEFKKVQDHYVTQIEPTLTTEEQKRQYKGYKDEINTLGKLIEEAKKTGILDAVKVSKAIDQLSKKVEALEEKAEPERQSKLRAG